MSKLDEVVLGIGAGGWMSDGGMVHTATFEAHKQSVRNLMYGVCDKVASDTPHWGGGYSDMTVITALRKEIESL